MSTLSIILFIYSIVLMAFIVHFSRKSELFRQEKNDLSKMADLDMINELMKRGILSAAPDGKGLNISPDVLREVHFHHMQEQQATNMKNAVDSAALTTALTIGLIHGLDSNNNNNSNIHL